LDFPKGKKKVGYYVMVRSSDTASTASLLIHHQIHIHVVISILPHKPTFPSTDFSFLSETVVSHKYHYTPTPYHPLAPNMYERKTTPGHISRITVNRRHHRSDQRDRSYGMETQPQSGDLLPDDTVVKKRRKEKK
jgi:hypothetical protein